jgi:hypothetical protein
MTTQIECVVRSDHQVGDWARKLFGGLDLPKGVCVSPDDKTKSSSWKGMPSRDITSSAVATTRQLESPGP